MARTTIFFGILLVLLGLVGYLGDSPSEGDAAQAANEATVDVGESNPSAPPSKRSVTSLIPACFGVILVFCGILAMNEKLRLHAMHAAVLVGLLGAVAGGGRGAMGLSKFLAEDPDLNRRAFGFVWLMAIICTIFVVLCIRSFIDARKRRKLEEGTAT